jgi:hypothetical protein
MNKDITGVLKNQVEASQIKQIKELEKKIIVKDDIESLITNNNTKIYQNIYKKTQTNLELTAKDITTNINQKLDDLISSTQTLSDKINSPTEDDYKPNTVEINNQPLLQDIENIFIAHNEDLKTHIDNSIIQINLPSELDDKVNTDDSNAFEAVEKLEKKYKETINNLTNTNIELRSKLLDSQKEKEEQINGEETNNNIYNESASPTLESKIDEALQPLNDLPKNKTANNNHSRSENNLKDFAILNITNLICFAFMLIILNYTVSNILLFGWFKITNILFLILSALIIAGVGLLNNHFLKKII